MLKFANKGTENNSDPGATPSEILRMFGFNALPYDEMPYFQDGVTHEPHDVPAKEELESMEIMRRDFWIQTGANEGDGVFIDLPTLNAFTLGLSNNYLGNEYSIESTSRGFRIKTHFGAPVDETEPALSVMSHDNAAKTITKASDALNVVSTERTKLGAQQNRLGFTYDNVTNAAENLTASESRIRDIDMAKEMTTLTKTNILEQAATAMLAQANSQPQNVLQLIK